MKGEPFGKCYIAGSCTTNRLPCVKGARRPRAVRETGRSRRRPGIPDQRSAGRYEDPSETGSIASALCEPGGPKGWSGEHTERSGVRRGNPSVSFADSSPYTGEPLGRRKARAVRTRRPRSGWSVEDMPKGHPQTRNTAQALAQGRTKAARCARNRPK